jgi:hypothetical protein
MKLQRMLFGCVALLTTLSVLHAADPVYDFTLKKAADSITATKDGDKTVFTVVAPSGIGNGTIVLKEGQWTKEIVLRFQASKTDAFKDLEKFSLTAGHIKVAGGRKQSKALPFYLAGPDGKFSDKPAGTLDIVIEPTKDALEVRLPANLLGGANKVEIAWIDVLR